MRGDAIAAYIAQRDRVQRALQGLETETGYMLDIFENNLKGMKDMQKNILRMRYLRDNTFQEIADTLGPSYNYIVRLHNQGVQQIEDAHASPKNTTSRTRKKK